MNQEDEYIEELTEELKDEYYFYRSLYPYEWTLIDLYTRAYADVKIPEADYRRALRYYGPDRLKELIGE